MQLYFNLSFPSDFVLMFIKKYTVKVILNIGGGDSAPERLLLMTT